MKYERPAIEQRVPVKGRVIHLAAAPVS